MARTPVNRQLIEQTFLDSLSKKPLNQITVKSITEACNLNRNTFYYYYKNIPDLLESIARDSVDDILKTYPPTLDSFEECLIAAIDYAKANREIINNIYVASIRSIFERHLWKLCEYTVTAYINSFPPSKYQLHASETPILVDFLKFECFGFIMDWINRGMPDNITQKITIFSKLVKQQVLSNIK